MEADAVNVTGDDNNNQQPFPVILDELGKPIGAAALAYLGDAVFELQVRKRLVTCGQYNLNGMHKAAVDTVSASAQAAALARLSPVLTPQEVAVVRMGRNTKTSVPRSASVSEYRLSTGFEALVGYLYLSGNERRLQELMNLVWEEGDRQDED
ncbi:MAG: ribonuclease III [Firmicutes bacterium]|nr:ribonuclease III [Bacillota bacterium]